MAESKLNPLAKKNALDRQVFNKITNENLVCHDCKLRYEDRVLPCNTSKCEIYETKPDIVLSGGECDEYVEE